MVKVVHSILETSSSLYLIGYGKGFLNILKAPLVYAFLKYIGSVATTISITKKEKQSGFS